MLTPAVRHCVWDVTIVTLVSGVQAWVVPNHVDPAVLRGMEGGAAVREAGFGGRLAGTRRLWFGTGGTGVGL